MKTTQPNPNTQGNTMQLILTPLKHLAAISLVVLAAGCATTMQNDENLAVAAGFKVITPVTPEQQAMFAKIPNDKITQITYEGKIFYVLADVKNNQAYVGGPAQYQTYRQLGLQQQMNENDLAAAQMNEMNSMNWGAWGGWGGMYGMGGFYR